MNTQIKVNSPTSLITFVDENYLSEVGDASPRNLQSLRKQSKVGMVFFMESEEPVYYKIDVYTDADTPNHLEELFTGRHGPFLLHAPSGCITVTANTASSTDSKTKKTEHFTFEIPKGDYVISIMDRANPDTTAHRNRLKDIIGENDWSYFERVNKTGVVGCFALVAAAILALIPYTRSLIWFLIPLLLLPEMFFFLLSHLPRFKKIKKCQEKYEDSLPTHIVSMHSVDSSTAFTGGWFAG